MKKLLTLLLAFAASLFINFEVEAAEIENYSLFGNDIIDGRSLSPDELSKIRESNEEFKILLTEKQAAERAAEVKGVSVEEIIAERNAQAITTMSAITPRIACSYVEANVQVKTSKTSYKPTLIVMPQVCHGGGATYINRNVEPYLWEFKAEDNYSYAGTIKIELQNGHYIYTVNGKFMSEGGSSAHSSTTGLTTPVITATYTFTGTTSNVHATTSQLRVKRDVLGF